MSDIPNNLGFDFLTSPMMRGALLLAVCSPVVGLFSNPFAALLGKQGPISLSARNFAVPSHPKLVTLQEEPPVYEIPGFLSEEECAALVAAAEHEEFPPIPYGLKNKIFTGTKWAAAGDPITEPFVEKSKALFGVSEKR